MTITNEGYMLDVTKEHVDLYAGGNCVKHRRIKRNEMQSDAIRRVVKEYIDGESFTEYLRLCDIVERKVSHQSIDRDDEGLWLEYLKSVRVRHLRELMRKGAEEYGQTD